MRRFTQVMVASDHEADDGCTPLRSTAQSLDLPTPEEGSI